MQANGGFVSGERSGLPDGTVRGDDPLDRVKREVREMAERLRTLDEVLEQASSARESVEDRRRPDTWLSVISGLGRINATLDLATRQCEREVLTAQPGGPRDREVLEQALPRDKALLERGVRMRTLYQHTARFNAPTQAYVRDVSTLGGQVRTLDQFFARLIVFDQRVAFIPDPEDRSTAVVVRHQAVVSFLTGAFERAWQLAEPFSSAYESRTDGKIVPEMQLAIARLLLHEDKDATIARSLGISERSCRGHIAKMMKELGARNRTHLGYLLASSGVLGASASDRQDAPGAAVPHRGTTAATGGRRSPRHR
ncbi:hypothetical protein GCM10010253_66120 [Streptomyces badius]|uniref:HTH luxR-type domain-containing protein n=1 Tax=Streptomyces badius TaxID=1941 RepID=A0ABQ2TPU0_STRBA|nr:hypothetical protein GCM10010253_66120 [Streptomyces badius]